MQKSLYLFPLLLTLLLPLSSHANIEAVGQVAALRNLATATSLTGESRQLSPKAPIYEGDTIQTGKRGRIQILFTDNTIISLGRNANLSIHEYLWQPEQKNGAMRTEVKEGIFRVMGGAITKSNPEQFTTKTPAATIGIRGSMYAGRVSGNSLSVVFQGGRGIFVENSLGRVEIPTPGHGTNVQHDQAPPPPVRFTPEEIDAFAPSDEDQPANEEQGDAAEGQEEEGAAPEEEDDEAPAPDEGETPPEDEEPIPAPEDEPPSLTDPPPTPEPPEPPVLPPPNEPEGGPILRPPTPWVLPTTGISHFHGSLNGTVTENDGTIEPLIEALDASANWHNNRVMGLSLDTVYESNPVFFFGTISGTDVTNIVFFGGSGGDMEVDTVEGTGSGSFGGYGTAGLFNLSGSGYDYDVEAFTQPQLATWTATGQAQLEITKQAGTGTSTWQGYVVGLGENMANIDTNRHLMRNADHGDFTMVVNKDTGVVSGSLYATDGTMSTNISIGGNTSTSAFIHDQFLGALLSGTVTNGTTASLKDHGNYLFTGPPDEQMMEYATWGYWETAYQNPDTSEQYHNHAPGAMWIAGEPTSSTDIASLAAGNVVGHYTGDVYASRIITGNMVTDVKGTFNMDVDFATLGAASAFSGTMNLDNLSTFTTHSISGPVDGHFKDGYMSNPDGFSGAISGTLYGPSAISIGGNFTTTNGTTTYQGIYGGNR